MENCQLEPKHPFAGVKIIRKSLPCLEGGPQKVLDRLFPLTGPKGLVTNYGEGGGGYKTRGGGT